MVGIVYSTQTATASAAATAVGVPEKSRHDRASHYRVYAWWILRCAHDDDNHPSCGQQVSADVTERGITHNPEVMCSMYAEDHTPKNAQIHK